MRLSAMGPAGAASQEGAVAASAPVAEASHEPGRPEFLVAGAATAAALAPVAPGRTRAGARAGKAVSKLQRWGLLIDVAKCADSCNACVTACHEENGVTSHNRPATDAQWIRKVTIRTAKPATCNRCRSCASTARNRVRGRLSTGVVQARRRHRAGGQTHHRLPLLHDGVSVPTRVHSRSTKDRPHAGKGTVESCTLCVHKVVRGDGTTARRACRRKATGDLFGNLNDANSEIRASLVVRPQLRPDLNLNTGVRYTRHLGSAAWRIHYHGSKVAASAFSCCSPFLAPSS